MKAKIGISPTFLAFLASQKDATVCWNWRRGTDPDGYGHVSFRGVRSCAHRVAYDAIRGGLRKGIPLLHSCDNPACCNPAHLRHGTQKDNYEDSRSRGRNSRGERNGCAKLTKRTILAIRRSTLSLTKLGKKYGIRWQYAWRIKKRMAWNHVN